jgi:aflatoxin B1 aldehyde reductase
VFSLSYIHILSGGLLVGRNISESDGGVIDAPGSRWDLTASSSAPYLNKIYRPVVPVLKQLKDVAVSEAPWHLPAL